MKTLCILALALAACSHAIPPRPESASDDAAAARAAEERSIELEQQLSALAASSAPPHCERVCPLVAQICDLSQRICLLAHRHGDDMELAKSCSAGEERCRRAREWGTSACSCPSKP